MKLIINTFDSLKRRLASAVSMLAIAFGSFLPGSVTVHAQTPQVNESGFSGVVVDTDGSPLPGAGVMVKGTSEGTVTDNDGRWSLDAGGGMPSWRYPVSVLRLLNLGWASRGAA